MSYELPALKYRYDALEPYIDARTMEIHYTQHHGGYVNHLNKLLSFCPTEVQTQALERILYDIKVVPESFRQGIRNYGGGHLNHCLYWETMGPKKGGEPSGSLMDAIRSVFDRFENFQKEFTKTAMNRFGSGWSWLCLNSQAKPELLSTPNQDSPLMHGCLPILGIDLWEHAYYLRYQNRREEYIAAWWNVVDWQRVAQIFTDRVESVIRA